MPALLRDRVNVSWLLLIAASFISWEAGRITNSTHLAGAGEIAIAIAFVKVHVVGREFMELRLAPVFLRHLFLTWTVSISATLMFLYSA